MVARHRRRRATFSLLIAAVTGSILSAQVTRGPSGPTSDPLSTRIGAFKAQRGKLIITDAILVAKIPDVGLGLEIKAVAMYEPDKESQKVKGVEFVLYGSSTELVRVDLDEVPEMERACSFLYRLASKLKDKEDPRAEYVTRSGLSVGIAKIESGDIQALLFYEGTLVPLPVDSLLKITEALKGASQILSSR
jgi:hypothetical protein